MCALLSFQMYCMPSMVFKVFLILLLFPTIVFAFDTMAHHQLNGIFNVAALEKLLINVQEFIVKPGHPPLINVTNTIYIEYKQNISL